MPTTQIKRVAGMTPLFLMSMQLKGGGFHASSRRGNICSPRMPAGAPMHILLGVKSCRSIDRVAEIVSSRKWLPRFLFFFFCFEARNLLIPIDNNGSTTLKGLFGTQEFY